jgi:hypothetical protein
MKLAGAAILDGPNRHCSRRPPDATLAVFRELVRRGGEAQARGLDPDTALNGPLGDEIAPIPPK